jgi:hypothetical protein
MITKLNRFNNILLIMIIVALAGCTTFANKNEFKDTTQSASNVEPDFIPIEPMENYSFTVLAKGKNGKGEWKTLYWSDLGSKNALINTYLPNHNASVVVMKKDMSGNLKFMNATLSGDAGSYRVLMDYMKYRIEPIYSLNEVGTNGQSVYLGTGKVGVGLRISADLVTLKSGIDLGSLFALGVAAKQGEIRGSLSVDVIGVDSKDITNLIPMNAVIDESSITQALQALASIKAKLHDPDVVLTPHVIAIRRASTEIKSEQVFTSTFIKLACSP